jgi:hypothetical protein
MNGEPYIFVDGLISKVGAYGSGSACKGDSANCNYDYYLGIDDTACGLKNNQGALDRMGVAAPLSFAFASTYDEGTRSGVLTVTGVLDARMAPQGGTFNGLTVLLYERDVSDRFGTDTIVFPQVVRRQLLFEVFPATQAGERAEFTVPFSLDAAWEEENMGALAFVQNYLGAPSDDPGDLIALDIHNSGFLSSVTAPPPAESRHTRPLDRP